MSTTLKALQRIEEQRVRRGSQSPLETNSASLEPYPVTDKASNWRFKARRWWPVVTAIALLLIFFTGLSHYIFSHRSVKAAAVVEVGLSQTPLQVKLPPLNPPPRQQEIPQSYRSPAPDPSAPMGASADGIETAPKNTSNGLPALHTINVSPWNGDGLKVQAIVYGPDPDARMAVINNRTIYQGSEVDGFVVVAIEEDAVIVRQGREKWKAMLGR